MSRLATIDMGQKVGAAVPPFGDGELDPHLTQCRLGRGLPPTKWHLDPSSRLATTEMGRKLRWGCAHLAKGELGPHLTQCGQGRGLSHAKFHLDPSDRLATIHQCYRQNRQTDNGPMAQGERFYKRSPKNSAFWSYSYYRTLIGSPMLEVEITGQRGRITTTSGQNVIETEKFMSSVS